MHSVAQTRELGCTKIVLPQVIHCGKYFCILSVKKELLKYTYCLFFAHRS